MVFPVVMETEAEGGSNGRPEEKARGGEVEGRAEIKSRRADKKLTLTGLRGEM
jgi:hypothetical protein